MLSIPEYIGTSIDDEKHILMVLGNTRAFASGWAAISHKTRVSLALGPQESTKGVFACRVTFINSSLYFEAVGSGITPKTII